MERGEIGSRTEVDLSEQAADPLAHLTGGLIREGNRQDRGRGHCRVVMICAMRCVMTRVLPLPAPARISSGPSVWAYGFALLRIQAFEKIHEESTEFNTQATLTLCIGDLPNRFCEPRATYSQPPRPRPVRKFQYTGKPKL